MIGEGWFKPKYQRLQRGDILLPEVEFYLRPLDVQAAYEAQTGMLPTGALAWSSVYQIFARNVIDWKGFADPCTPQARAEVLATRGPSQGFDLRDWLIWFAEIAGHLYRQSVLTDDERKN